MKQDTSNTGKQEKPFDNLTEQIINISKAGAFDIVSKQVQELQEENARLKERVKYLQDLIKEYTGKMLVNLSGGKVDEFLKEQILDPNDIPETLFQKPGNPENIL